MAVCAICGKTNVAGALQRHGRGVAGKRWKKRAQVRARTFAVNIQPATLVINGKPVKVKLCAKCIKRQKKDKKHSSLALT